MDQQTGQSESAGFQEPAGMPIYGYTRLTFFNTKIWQYLIVLLFIAGVAALVFPGRRMLVNHYKNKEMLNEALSVLSDAGRTSSDDSDLMRLSADLYQKTGNPEKAIEAMERLIEKKPNDPDALIKLVKLYENVRNPRKLIVALERSVKAIPKDVRLWKSLVENYGYQGDVDRQTKAMVQVILLEKDLPMDDAYAYARNSKSVKTLHNDPIVKAVGEELERLSEKYTQENRNTPLGELIRQLYTYRLNVIRAIQRRDPLFPDHDTAVIRSLEPFVRTGMLEEGVAFATRLDRDWGQGSKHRLQLVRVMRWSKQDRQAFLLLSQVHAEHEDDMHILFQMAEIALENDDVHKAISIYEKLAGNAPEELQHTQRLAELYLQSNNPHGAFEAYKSIAVKKGACDPRLIQVAGYTGNRRLAREAAELNRQLCPDDPAVLKTAAEALVAANAQRDAIDAYRQYLALNPADREAAFRLAELYTWVNESRNAYVLYKTYVTKAGTTSPPVEKMMNAAAATGNPEVLKEAVLLAVEKRPHDDCVQLESAKRLSDHGLYPEAIEIYQRYVSRKPDDTDVKQQLTELYQWTGQTDKAAELLAKASDREPDSFERAVSAGNALVEADKAETGVSYFERASHIRPDSIGIRKRLANYYRWTEQTDKMIGELEYLDSRGQVPEEDKMLLAQAYLDRKQGLKALEKLKHIAARSPLPVKPGMMLASAYELAGRNDEAVSLYKRLGKENAKDADLLADLGNQALWMGKTDIALKLFESALKTQSRNRKALKASAQIYAWNHNPEKAIKRFEAYNRIVPDDYEAQYQLGELYFLKGREHNAIKQYNKALALIKRSKRMRAEAVPAGR